VLQFTLPSRHTRTSRALLDFARGSFPAGKPVLAGAWDLTRRVFKEFSFDPTATDISTPVEQVLRDKRGVCQDFAHLMLAAMRSLGLPARYVSGYLMTLPPPGMVRLQGADASHAWISAWSPEAGWIDFDPTNGVIPSEQHITVAYGRDYDDVSPISGVLLGGGDQVISVGVDVIPDAA
jgi:transglutaminase-like putative cysteine protease